MGTAVRHDKPAIVAWCEIGYVLACVLAGEWVIPPRLMKDFRVRSIPVALVLIGGFISHWQRSERPSELGFRLDNFLRALRLLVTPMLIAFCMLLMTGWAAGSINIAIALDPQRFLRRAAPLFLWGLQQQYALQAVVNRRMQVILGKGSASALAVALVFAGLHAPNLALVVATFVGGIIWASVYQRTPNLFVLALSHCVMTTVLAATLPPQWLHGLRVGAGYFNR
ncbi:MAG: CPBP family intramembrane metalloprotease [Acidobacteriia bacterium]|nr:CPBP family intramembrane metalloprotease [Terriglobia bacterium]